jgi:SAM-dependent methyltransferase
MDSRQWDARYAAEELVWSAAPNRFLAAEVDGLAPGRALDLACGEGRNAIWLAERGWAVTAVDFSAVALAKAAGLAAGRGVAVDWIEADVVTWRPEPLRYDLVAVVYLQLPPPERAAALHAAAGAVAPGGTLVVVAHDIENLSRGHGGPQDPELLYRPDEVADVAGSAGLVVEHAGRVTRPVDTEEGPVVAVDTLARARRPGRGPAPT